MNGPFLKKTYESLDGIEFPATVKDGKFRSSKIDWSEGKNVEFKNCDFSRSLINRCYFHRAVFIDCDFTGTVFIETNLRGAKFIGCKFEYAQFRNTLVDASTILDNLPEWENVRRELLRGLRKNAESIGEMEDVRTYFYAEMDASAEHWRSVLKQTTRYYKTHYPGFKWRVKARSRLMFLKLSKWCWGYGESPPKLLLSALGWVACLAFILSLVQNTAEEAWNAMKFVRLFPETLLLFLGASTRLTAEVDPLFLALVYLSRYVVLGLVASVAIRRYTRR